MESRMHTYREPDGTVQRVQWVRWEDWPALEFLRPQGSREALDRFAQIYRRYLIPACPWIFGSLVLFQLPENLELPLSQGRLAVSDPLTAAAMLLQKGVSLPGGKPVFRSRQAEQLWRQLEWQDCLRIVRGKLPTTQVIPVGNACGYLTGVEQDARLKVNGSFFIMDPFDCATAFDHVGTPLGLLVKNGRVENPPLFRREALMVRKDGTVSVETPGLEDLALEIGGACYRPGQNTRVWSRPEAAWAFPGKRKCLVVVGCRVAAVYSGGPVPVPASGFVLCPEGECSARPGDMVTYRGMEDVRFGIQVGNSILRRGIPTEGFRSRFYNIRHLEPVPFPPSLYPMDFQNARAARMALGADRQGRPMVLWAEGAPKLGYVPGQDSRGASLADMPRFCLDAGMVEAVNLDGGGSAQLLLNGVRSLRISDRCPDDLSETQRPIPLGLMVRR